MTAQIPDILIVRGKRLDLCTTPLEVMYETDKSLRRPRFVAGSSACWRGYVATWEIIDGQLWLTGIEGQIARGRKGNVKIEAVTLRHVFSHDPPPIPASWFHDILRCPEGGCRSYSHHGFASIYERDRLFFLSSGHVIEEWLRINPPDPLLYKVEADGRRQRYDAFHHEREPILDDPFAQDEVPKGHVVWGKPDTLDEGYAIAAMTTFGTAPTTAEG